MNREKIQSLYAAIVKALIDEKLTVSAMESCTGGQIASLITNVEGASQIIKSSYVTYSNESKVEAGVRQDIIDKYTVYSPETAQAMAFAVLHNTNSNFGISVTGTLGRIDPANPTNPKNKAFYCVIARIDNILYRRQGDIFFTEDKTREEMKYEIAEKVAFLIKDILLCKNEE